VVKRPTPPRSGLWRFFRRVGLGAGGLRCRALTALPSLRYRRPLSAPHTSGGALALALASAEPHAPLRPRHLSVPSSRPTPQGGGTGAVRQGAAGAGGGAAHGRRGRPSPPGEAPERGSHHPPRAAGAWPRGSWAFPEAAPHAWQSPRRRLPPCTSRAASGAPAPRPTPGATCAYRRPGGVFTCQRRPAPAAGPGASRRCPGRGWAPIASGTCGQREGPAARARPLPSRPTCETPGLFGSLRSRRVCPPPLWHP
jgi:hypothetical protein